MKRFMLVLLLAAIGACAHIDKTALVYYEQTAPHAQWIGPFHADSLDEFDRILVGSCTADLWNRIHAAKLVNTVTGEERVFLCDEVRRQQSGK